MVDCIHNREVCICPRLFLKASCGLTGSRRVGIYHGRPTSISAKDVDAEMPVARPDLFPSSNPINIAHMIATIQLNQALSRLAHKL